MQKRKLGNGDLDISALGLRCMGMTFSYGPPPDRPAMISLLQTSVDRGVTFFDTARSTDHSTTRSWLAKRWRPFAAMWRSPPSWLQAQARRRARLAWPRQPARAHQRGRRRSLKRLKVEALDLFYQHRVDPDVPIEDVAGAVKDLIQQGKVKHFGLSEAAAETIRRAHAVQPVRPCKANTHSGRESLKRKYCRHSKSSALASCRTARSARAS